MDKIALILIIIVGILCLIGLFYWFFKKKLGLSLKLKLKTKPKQKKEKPQKEKPQKYTLKNFNLTLNQKFMYRRDLLFWKFLNTILPRTFVVVPKVAICTLIDPNGDKNLYNDLSGKTVDFVVFDEQDMRPILVVDLYDKSFNDDRLDEDDPQLYAVVTKLGLSVVHILMKAEFDRDAVKKQIYEKLNITIDKND